MRVQFSIQAWGEGSSTGWSGRRLQLARGGWTKCSCHPWAPLFRGSCRPSRRSTGGPWWWRQHPRPESWSRACRCPEFPSSKKPHNNKLSHSNLAVKNSLSYGNVDSIPLDQICQSVEQDAPVWGVHAPPRATKLEGITGSFDSQVDVGLDDINIYRTIVTYLVFLVNNYIVVINCVKWYNISPLSYFYLYFVLATLDLRSFVRATAAKQVSCARQQN